jgi:DNA repair exonuclease SbcCD ATPase subunit
MQILSLEFRNFNSYGNRIQRIEFPTDAAFFLVQGPNGVGKTTSRR